MKVGEKEKRYACYLAVKRELEVNYLKCSSLEEEAVLFLTRKRDLNQSLNFKNMANGAMQVIGVFLTLICWALTFIACCLPYWRSNDIEGEVIETIRRSSGLWTKCTYIR